MGEYVKYRGEFTKIGTCEDMYYTSFERYNKFLEAGKLFKAEGSLSPDLYVSPDSENRFRFPFPDEDTLPFGDIIGSFDRGVPVTLKHRELTEDEEPGTQGRSHELTVVRQKLIHREEDGKLCLVVVCRNTETGDMFRIESKREIKKIISEIIRNHILNAQDPEQKSFYREVAGRMLKGYRIDIYLQKIE